MKKIFASLFVMALGTVAFSQTTETKSNDNNSKSNATTITTAPAITTTTPVVTTVPAKRRFVKTTPVKVQAMTKPVSTTTTEPTITNEKEGDKK